MKLNKSDAALIKAMLKRGDKQHDIAAYFGVNSGRIAEIARGQSFANVSPSSRSLPPQGPYYIRDMHRRLLTYRLRSSLACQAILNSSAEIERILPKGELMNCTPILDKLLQCAHNLERP